MRRLIQLVALAALFLGLVTGPAMVGRLELAEDIAAPNALCAIDHAGSNGT